jgi:hypothetical protein
MKAARYAIGSVLIHRDTLSPDDFQPSPFEFHEINALVTLSMASDRARDFVVLAVIDEPPRANHELDQYRLALCTARNRGLAHDVAALEALTPDVRSLKDARNAAVHKVAMKSAKVQREILERDRRAASARKVKPAKAFVWDSSAVVMMAREAAAAHQTAIEDRIATLRRGYEAIIKSGDLAFRLENEMRQRRRSGIV